MLFNIYLSVCFILNARSDQMCRHDAAKPERGAIVLYNQADQ